MVLKSYVKIFLLLGRGCLEHLYWSITYSKGCKNHHKVYTPLWMWQLPWLGSKTRVSHKEASLLGFWDLFIVICIAVVYSFFIAVELCIVWIYQSLFILLLIDIWVVSGMGILHIMLLWTFFIELFGTLNT